MAAQELRGKTALVTGAAKRIGRAIALALAGEGMDLVIHYRQSEAEARSLQQMVRDLGRQAWTLQADFSDPQQTATAIERALNLAGQLDLLVNSASSFEQSNLAELDFAAFVEAMTVNAWSPFALARDYCERVGRGQVINLLDARVGGYDLNHVGYLLAKTCLHKMTQMLALQYAPRVAVNAILPGLILPPPGQDGAYLDGLAATVPLQRHGDPEDIAQTVVFLARSTFPTGAMIHVDGGGHLKE